jgi:hypothetical protein
MRSSTSASESWKSLNYTGKALSITAMMEAHLHVALIRDTTQKQYSKRRLLMYKRYTSPLPTRMQLVHSVVMHNSNQS